MPTARLPAKITSKTRTPSDLILYVPGLTAGVHHHLRPHLPQFPIVFTDGDADRAVAREDHVEDPHALRSDSVCARPDRWRPPPPSPAPPAVSHRLHGR